MTALSDVEILRKAKLHISNPAMWYKGDFSASGYQGSVDGEPCCGLGAVAFVKKGAWACGVTRAALEQVGSEFGHYNFASFNDHPDTTHADVMAAFDRAIALALGAQP